MLYCVKFYCEMFDENDEVKLKGQSIMDNIYIFILLEFYSPSLISLLSFDEDYFKYDTFNKPTKANTLKLSNMLI